MSAYAALLLDLDGTLVDSEPKHIEAHRRFLRSEGIPFTEEDLLGNIGRGDRSFYRRLIDQSGRGGDPDDWVRRKTAMLVDLYRQEGLALRPGAQVLLDRAWRLGIACAVVTSAERGLCLATLMAVGLAQRLPTRICFEDTVHHKPHPLPYQLCCQRLGVPPGRCLALEDSPSGVASARTAGCTVFAIPDKVEERALLAAGATRLVRDLSEVELAS